MVVFFQIIWSKIFSRFFFSNNHVLFSYSSSCQEILSSLNIMKTNETELQTNYSQDNQRPQWSTPEKTFTVMFSPTLRPRYLGHTYGTLQLSLCVSYKNLSQFLNIIFLFWKFLFIHCIHIAAIYLHITWKHNREE